MRKFILSSVLAGSAALGLGSQAHAQSKADDANKVLGGVGNLIRGIGDAAATVEANQNPWNHGGMAPWGGGYPGGGYAPWGGGYNPYGGYYGPTGGYAPYSPYGGGYNVSPY